MPHAENTAAQTITTTTETVVLGFGPARGLDVPAGQPTIGLTAVPSVITGVVNMTPGAAATQVTVRIRQGGLTGPIVGVAQADDVTAAVPVEINFEAYDATGNPAGYVVTVQQTAATGNGTVNLVSADMAYQ